ncbi:hypothetical protein GCK72_017194 [Caenorhabditis remanei]|uniref:CX domain-containing protein n=1 Tax=Caenorhabditis remanei TaxID=31234 RepID=A0A6A5G787_CAERE|nr:hypothetical protein GCK72_017194 [Caenorhabditis remanei]KAF1750643.1 hypothetical protein GCK72_017194 [Caenorhabditis remanei]
MNVSPIFSILLLLILKEKCSARSGGRGGGGARGRSSYHSSGGGKFHSSSSHSSYIHHDSSAFRSTVFKPSTSNSYFSSSSGTHGNTYIISQPATPIIYDNHYYYWHGYYHSHPSHKLVCQYTISQEDGELFNVTFSNGTSPKSITFGCGSFETCCGMTCCSTLGTWIAVSRSRSSIVSHGSSSFRSNVFKPSTSNTYFTSGGSTGNTFIISQPATPVIHDNHHYYWHGYYRSRPEKETYCEYAIGEDDGELVNVTFANGTSPKLISFGCGYYERCCGMTCCSSTGNWVGLSRSAFFHSLAFRSIVFDPSNFYMTYKGSNEKSYTIRQPETPIIYDSRPYYWRGYYQSIIGQNNYCEYAFGEDDRELRNVTFANGTAPKSVSFGCEMFEECCGMSCCNVFSGWKTTLFLWILLFVALITCCMKTREEQEDLIGYMILSL